MNDTLPARILVIDDNTAIHDDFRKVLNPEDAAAASHDQAAAALFRRTTVTRETSPVQLDFATQGQDGLACVRRAIQAGRPYEMAFVDMRMPPGWDGLETIAQVWKVQPELLVVICTAFADYSWEEINKRLGQSDRLLILKKPFDNVEIRQLADSLAARSAAERRLNTTQKRLLEASRLVGMAEVANGVLHNVGNALNSLNVSTGVVCDRLGLSRLPLLRKSVALLQQHSDDLPGFLTTDPKGRALPEFLEKLAGQLEEENAGLREEMQSVSRGIEHIKQIVSTQQNYGRAFGVIETLDPREVIEDAARLTGESLARHRITLVRDFASKRPVCADRHKVLQILVNLVRNAKQAVIEADPPERRIAIRVTEAAPDRLIIAVTDTGTGIPEENLAKIFQHGFTTKKDGHGFGLHASILSAREMKGDLTVHSDGPGRGATFTLELAAGLQP